jgi:hypothetical protein
MDLPVVTWGSFEDEGRKLKACEENLRRYHQLALAGRLVGATMHEVNNRLAAFTNLIFLARTLSECALRSIEYLDEAGTRVQSYCGHPDSWIDLARTETKGPVFPAV